MKTVISIILIIASISVSNAKPPSRLIGNSNLSTSHLYSYYVSVNINGKHLCGGTIIHERWVLTAASCIVGMSTKPYHNLRIIAGSPVPDNTIAYTVRIILVTELYNPHNPSLPNDIALVQLEYPIRFSYFANKLALASGPIPLGTIAYATGWSVLNPSNPIINRKLISFPVNTIPPFECQPFVPQVLYKDQFCVQSLVGGGICQGDSGNPLIYQNKLIGIASGNVGCGGNLPDIYTNVYEFLDWINGYVTGQLPVPQY